MKILAATNNADKLVEIRRVLEPLGVSVVSPADVNVNIQVEETGATFTENALLKARAFFEASGLPSLADDSGLCVDALDGRPGLHTAYYQGENASYPQRISALVDELKDVPEGQRTARFVCHLCFVTTGTGTGEPAFKLATPGAEGAPCALRIIESIGEPAFKLATPGAEGTPCTLRIIESGGVGNDLFALECSGVCEGEIGRSPKGDGGFGYDPIFYVDGKSMAERPKEEKDYLSHRGRALREFAALLGKLQLC